MTLAAFWRLVSGEQHDHKDYQRKAFEQGGEQSHPPQTQRRLFDELPPGKRALVQNAPWPAVLLRSRGGDLTATVIPVVSSLVYPVGAAGAVMPDVVTAAWLYFEDVESGTPRYATRAFNPVEGLLTRGRWRLA